ncbi:hypothetical protein ACR9YC_02100 [Parasphingorhabdus sp. DH2-15]|uniref:hypothetical protein n=1 Tax=Parasphingorhabdus sp. DH2-15 TaxID=3444112 RepID=UPI003F687F46
MTNQPEDTIRDGNIKATIWPNQGENGPFVSVDLTKIYRDHNGDLRDTRSFSASDMLRVSEVARKAYDRGRDLQRELRRKQQPEQSRNDDRRARFDEQRNAGNRERKQERTY